MRTDHQKELRSFYRRNPEVERLVKRRRGIFFLKLILLEVAIALVAYEIVRYGLPLCAAVIGGIAAIVLPLLFLHPKRTLGRGYVGEIVESKHTQRRDVEVGRGLGKARESLTYTVLGADGKKHRFTVLALYGKVYHRGGRVLCIPVLDLPIPLTPKEHTVCPFCKARMLTAVDHCTGCGAKPMDV